jgi:hypothetical protein
MPEILLEAGPVGILAVLGALIGAALAVTAATAAPRRALVLAGFVLACGAGCVQLGLVNSFYQRAELLKASAHVSPADRPTLEAAGDAERAASLKLCLGAGLPVFVLGLGLLARQFSRRPEAA